MARQERVRRFIAAARRFLAKVIRRGEREAQIRQLEWQLGRQKAALGNAIYPLLQSGQVQVQTELPEVRERMTRIAALVQSLEELEHSLAAQRTDQVAENEDEARWANEGGRNVG